MFLFGILSLLGCQMTAPEEEVETTEEVGTTEEGETAEEGAGISCKGVCLLILRACLRAAESDEDRAECALNHDACVMDCEDCGETAPCPLPD